MKIRRAGTAHGVVVVLVIGILSAIQPWAWAQAPPTAPASSLSDEIDAATKAYVDSLDNGELTPVPPRFAACLTAEQKAALTKLHKAWQAAYDKAVAETRKFMLDQLALRRSEEHLEASLKAEGEATADYGFADPAHKPAAKEKMERARRERKQQEIYVDEDHTQLNWQEREVQYFVGRLRAARQAFVAEQVRLKGACPPPADGYIQGGGPPVPPPAPLNDTPPPNTGDAVAPSHSSVIDQHSLGEGVAHAPATGHPNPRGDDDGPADRDDSGR